MDPNIDPCEIPIFISDRSESNETVVTLIHSSSSAMVRNNVHNAFHSNLLFLSCGNNLLIVRDTSGVLVWTNYVKKHVHAS